MTSSSLTAVNVKQSVSISVVIPCYNAVRWVGQAIESCLEQSLPPSEIIVVDDGSEDGSGNAVRRYGGHVHYIRQNRSGAQVARNLGFTLSSGGLVQFLDADDLILPEKFATQAPLLLEGGSDAVYSAWRHQHHEPNGLAWLEEVNYPGRPSDLVAALLSGWWISPAALLFRREIVEAIGGWDERLSAAQDRDFFIRVAMASNRVHYVAECQAIYRRYGDTTISTSNRERWARSHAEVLVNSGALLSAVGKLTPTRRNALSQGMFSVARCLYPYDKKAAAQLASGIRKQDPSWRPKGPALYRMAFRLFGFSGAEKFSEVRRGFIRRTDSAKARSI